MAGVPTGRAVAIMDPLVFKSYGNRFIRAWFWLHFGSDVMTSGQFNGNAIAIVIIAVFFNCPFVTVGDGVTIGFACVTQVVPQSVAFTESGQR